LAAAGIFAHMFRGLKSTSAELARSESQARHEARCRPDA